MMFMSKENINLFMSNVKKIQRKLVVSCLFKSIHYNLPNLPMPSAFLQDDCHNKSTNHLSKYMFSFVQTLQTSHKYSSC
jgi:hypothetical protein